MSLINKKELRKEIREIVKEEISNLENDRLKKIGLTRQEVIDEIHASIQQRAFKTKNAAKYIDRSTATLNRLVEKGQIKKNVNGSLTYYTKEELDRWIDEGK